MNEKRVQGGVSGDERQEGLVIEKGSEQDGSKSSCVVWIGHSGTDEKQEAELEVGELKIFVGSDED